MRNLVRPLTATIVLACAVAPAAATQFTYVFDSHTGGDLSGNGRLVSTLPTGVSNPGLTVTSATAWTAVKSGTNVNITQSNLYVFDGGLGVSSDQYDAISGCGGVGGCNMHQIDNVGNTPGTIAYDFVQVTFSQAVTLAGMSRTAFGQSDVSPTLFDDDASYGSGATLADVRLNHTDRTALTALTANSTGNATASRTWTQFSQMLGNTLLSGDSTAGNGSNSDGSCKSRYSLDGQSVCYDTNTLATTSSSYTASTTWWISAALLNPDTKSDAFKLYDFKVVYNDTPGPVPEPASWMTMIAGFGFIGAALRRKAATRRLAA